MNARISKLLVLVPAALAGCADVFGLGDYTLADDASASADAGLPDVGVGADGCGGPDLACVPAVAAGWTYVAYDQAFRSSCASRYGTPVDVSEGISAPAATCTCGCDVTASTCSTLHLTVGNDSTCSNETKQVENGTACSNLSATIATKPGDQIAATGAPSGGGCTPDAGTALPAITFGNQGRICELAVAPGACDQGMCVPSPAPYGACVRHAGALACPAGYPVAHQVGTTVADTRGCSACTCGFDAGACGGSLVIAQNGGCNQGAQTIPVNGTCTSVPGGMYKSFAYTPIAASATCTPSTTAPTGDASFSDLATICCTQ